MTARGGAALPFCCADEHLAQRLLAWVRSAFEQLTLPPWHFVATHQMATTGDFRFGRAISISVHAHLRTISSLLRCLFVIWRFRLLADLNDATNGSRYQLGHLAVPSENGGGLGDLNRPMSRGSSAYPRTLTGTGRRTGVFLPNATGLDLKHG
jgi:hypothetical protein